MNNFINLKPECHAWGQTSASRNALNAEGRPTTSSRRRTNGSAIAGHAGRRTGRCRKESWHGGKTSRSGRRKESGRNILKSSRSIVIAHRFSAFFLWAYEERAGQADGLHGFLSFESIISPPIRPRTAGMGGSHTNFRLLG